MRKTTGSVWGRVVGGTRIQYIAAFVAALSGGCGGSGSPTAPPASPTPSVSLQQLLVRNPGDLGVGKTVQMRADGRYSDGSIRELTTQVTWSSSNTAVATVTPDGRATGHVIGAVTIRAAYQGHEATRALDVYRGWQVSLAVQRIECIGDCEDFTQGEGDFSYKVELAVNGDGAKVVAETASYPSGASVIRLATGESFSINRTEEFAIRDADGGSVGLTFRATEWDEDLLTRRQETDARMNNESSTARYQYRANNNWLPEGSNYITIGPASCRLRLHYTIVKD